MNEQESYTIAKEAIKALDSKKAFNMKLLHVTKQTVIADYFVLACGSNNTQIHALADEVEFQLTEKGYEMARREGYGASEWVVLDFHSVIVHIFSRDARTTFNLEKLWADATDVDITDLID